MTGGVTPAGGLGAINIDPDVPAQPQKTNPTRNKTNASFSLLILFSSISFFPKKDYLELGDASEVKLPAIPL
jgi:hypothetical protein